MQVQDFDVVLYGASGFTGRQTVQYFAEHAPSDLRWAIAGRNREKLKKLNAGVPVLVADSSDSRQADELVRRSRVLLTTAGPFALYGDRLVEACVNAGTHYVDITGETAWVRSLIDRFHERAAAGGTRIIPFCGFDSVPADLGVSLLAKQLGPGLTSAKAYYTAKGGSPNGGTIASAHYTYSSGAAAHGRDLFLLSPGHQPRALDPIERDPKGMSFDKDVQAWTAPFPMSIIDTRVVRRSCSLLGMDVAYQEYIVLRGVLAPVFATGVAAGTALFYKAMETAVFRNLAVKLVQAGKGPSEEVMDNGRFSCRFFGRSSDGRIAEAAIAGQGDPANRITVKCVCESALALACDYDQLPIRAGVLTPSVGLGDVLVNRLRARGMTISPD